MGPRSSSHPPVPATPVNPPLSRRTREVELAPTTRARPPRGWGLTAWGAANREELTASGGGQRGGVDHPGGGQLGRSTRSVDNKGGQLGRSTRAVSYTLRGRQLGRSTWAVNSGGQLGRSTRAVNSGGQFGAAQSIRSRETDWGVACLPRGSSQGHRVHAWHSTGSNGVCAQGPRGTQRWHRSVGGERSDQYVRAELAL